jgi:hypothetical protein
MSTDELEHLEALLAANRASSMEMDRASARPPNNQEGMTRTEGLASREEEQLRNLLRINEESGRVVEDFVELSIPGYDASTPSGSSSRGVVASPRLAFGSVTSGVTRGGGFGGITGKKFGVVKLFSDDGMCLADIGDGAKFCTRLGCSTVSHRAATKFKLDEDGTIAIAKSRDVAFASPVLGGSVLPQEVQEEWSQMEKTLEEWSQLFKASSQEENFSSSAEYESRLRDQQNSELFKTPAKKKGQVSSYLMTGLQNLSVYTQAVSPGKREFFQQSTPGEMADVVLGLDDALDALSRNFVVHVRETQDAVSGLEMSDAMLEMKEASIEGHLGSMSLMGSSNFQHPTVFGTMAGLSRKIEEMILAGPPVVDFSPIQAEVEGVQSEGKRFHSLFINLVTNLSNKVGSMESWKQERGIKDSHQTAPHIHQGSSMRFQDSSFRPQSSSEVNVTQDKLADILSRVEYLESERANHQIEIQRLIAEGDDDAIKFAGLGLKTIEETRSWIEINSPGGAFDFSLIPDVYFILDIVAADGETSQSSMLQTLNRLRTLELTSEYQAKSIAAFLLEVPRFFHGPSESGAYASGAGESQLSKLPNIKSWNQGQGSRKKLLERKLPGIRQSFRTLITNSLMSQNPRMYSIATEALERSISWITSLASWIDRSFENAHISSKLSEAKSWALVTQLVRRVFAEIFVVRMGTTQSMSSDRKSMCTAILWSVFRTHDKMSEFENANFEDHPSISSEHIKFYATNSGFDMLASLEKDVSGMKSEAKELDRKIVATQRKADSASTGSDLNKKAIAELSKRVDKKADK